MITVEIGDVVFVPLHINSIFMGKKLTFYASLDEKKVACLFDQIKKDLLYIIDFENIGDVLTTSTISEIVNQTDGKYIILVNVSEGLKNQLLEKCSHLENVSTTEGHYLVSKMKTCFFDYSKICDFLYLREYLRDVLIKNKKMDLNTFHPQTLLVISILIYEKYSIRQLSYK